MEDVLKIVKSLEYSGMLLNGVSETIKDEAKEQIGGFLSMSLCTLGASLLGNMLARKGFIKVGEGTARVGNLSNLSKIIQMYYQNELRFNGVYFRDNLSDEIKDGMYVINLDEYSDIGTHWIALYVNTKTVTYFDSFGVEHIPNEIKKIVDNKNIITNIFGIQTYD